MRVRAAAARVLRRTADRLDPPPAKLTWTVTINGQRYPEGVTLPQAAMAHAAPCDVDQTRLRLVR